MTHFCSITETLSSIGVTRKAYLNAFDGSVLLASAELTDFYQGEYHRGGACGVSFDGRYVSYSNYYGTYLLDSKTGNMNLFPFTTKFVCPGYGPDDDESQPPITREDNLWMGHYSSFYPKFHPDGYFYNAFFTQRVKLDGFVFEDLPKFPNYGIPNFVSFDASRDLIFASYDFFSASGDLIRCFDLKTRQEISLPSFLTAFIANVRASLDAETLFYGITSFMGFSDSGEYLLWRVYGLNYAKRYIVNMLTGEVQELPFTAQMVYNRAAPTVFTETSVVYFEALDGATDFSQSRLLIKDLRTGAVISKALPAPGNWGNASPSPWRGQYSLLRDGQYLYIPSDGMELFYAYSNPQVQRGYSIDMLTGELAPALSFAFSTYQLPAGTFALYLTAAASQPRITLVDTSDGRFWTRMVYAKEEVING